MLFLSSKKQKISSRIRYGEFNRSSYLIKRVGTDGIISLIAFWWYCLKASVAWTINLPHISGNYVNFSLIYPLWINVGKKLMRLAIVSYGFRTQQIILLHLFVILPRFHFGSWLFLIQTELSVISSALNSESWRSTTNSTLMSDPVATPVINCKYLRKNEFPHLG